MRVKVNVQAKSGDAQLQFMQPVHPPRPALGSRRVETSSFPLYVHGDILLKSWFSHALIYSQTISVFVLQLLMPLLPMASPQAPGTGSNDRGVHQATQLFRLLDLPLEERLTVLDFTLTASTGRIFLFEEHSKLRASMTSNSVMPAGGFTEAFASWSRHNIELSKRYNQLQYTSK